MKVLIVASYNKQHFVPFIMEQAEALQQVGVEVAYFGVQGKGIQGYLSNRKTLLETMRTFQPDIIHAHYGLSGLLANLQRQIPVVTTYHGSDINDKRVLLFSKIAMCLSAWNIFVSQRNIAIAKPHKRFSLLPCGINIQNFSVQDKTEARKALGWTIDVKKVLFAGAFDNKVKNAQLAQAAVGCLTDVELIELRGYSREQVATLFCAADALLLTSFTEGSPQVIKEAMACGCPIVSVDVGDVAERIAGLDNCYIVQRDAQEIAQKLTAVIAANGRTEGRRQLLEMGLDNTQVAEQLIHIYTCILSPISQ